MNLNTQIMNENILYLNEWMKYNTALQGNLQIVGPDLVCNIHGRNEAIDISDYYLPNILYNPILREHIQDKDKINAEDLFRIIRVNVLAESLKSQKSHSENELYITKMDMKKDDNNQLFLSFEDNYGHKFKVTKNIDQVLQVYQKLAEQKTPIKLYELKEKMEMLNHGESGQC